MLLVCGLVFSHRGAGQATGAISKEAYAVDILTAPGAPKDLRFSALPTNQIAFAATVSKDGSLLAYCTPANSGIAIRLRDMHLATERQLLGPVSAECRGMALADDSQSLFYSLKLNGADTANIYRFSFPDGPPSLVAQDVQTPFTVNPRGDSVAFLRRLPNPKRPETPLVQLIIAHADHSGERAAVQSEGDTSPVLAGPDWSPSGDQTVFAHSELINGTHLALLDVATGHQHPLGDARWTAIQRIHWMRDNTGLAILGVGETQGKQRTSIRPSLWFVKYPFTFGRGARQIFDDPSEFFGLSSTVTGDLITTATVPDYSVDVVSLEDQTSIRRVHPKVPRASYESLTWVSSSDLAALSAPAIQGDPWKVVRFSASRGSSPPARAEPEILRCATSTPVAVGSAVQSREAPTGSQTVAIQKLNLDALETSSPCLPNGKRSAVHLYAPPPPPAEGIRAVSQKARVETIPLVGISPNLKLEVVPLIEQVFQAALSPDGNFVATFEVPSAKSDPARVLLYDAQRNRLLATFTLPGTAANLAPVASLGWAPGGKAIAFLLQNDGHSNLWTLPFISANPSAPGKVTQLTHLREGLLTGFSFSPDGREVAFSYNDLHYYVLDIAGVR
jgi:Tol biopolymer transport system component